MSDNEYDEDVDETGNASFYVMTVERYRYEHEYTEPSITTEPGAVETKVITTRKIVSYKCCLPSSNISVKRDFDTDNLFI